MQHILIRSQLLHYLSLKFLSFLPMVKLLKVLWLPVFTTLIGKLRMLFWMSLKPCELGVVNSKALTCLKPFGAHQRF